MRQLVILALLTALGCGTIKSSGLAAGTSLSGSWRVTHSRVAIVFTLAQRGDDISGTALYSRPEQSEAIEGRLEGRRIRLNLRPLQDTLAPYKSFVATLLSDRRMVGTLSVQGRQVEELTLERVAPAQSRYDDPPFSVRIPANVLGIHRCD